MQQQPASVQFGVGEGLVAGVKRRHDSQQDRDGQKKNAKRYRSVQTSKDQEGDGQEQPEHGEGLVRIDRQRTVRGDESFRQRHEVEESAAERCRHSDVPPTRPVVERSRQHRQRGNAVEEDRDA
jgi:hypothetical protein